MVGLFPKSLFSKIQNLAFFKTKFGLFQLQAAGNPGTDAQCTHTHTVSACVPYVAAKSISFGAYYSDVNAISITRLLQSFRDHSWSAKAPAIFSRHAHAYWDQCDVDLPTLTVKHCPSVHF